MNNCEILHDIIESRNFETVRVFITEVNGNGFTSVFTKEEVFWFDENMIDMEHGTTHFIIKITDDILYDEDYKSFEFRQNNVTFLIMF